MEKLLHYLWKHRIMPLHPLRTTGGDEVEIVDPGLANNHAGPDFMGAKLRIGGTLWVGSVEIHERSSDWFLHGHDTDSRYNNVVLHVAQVTDVDVMTQSGLRLPQLQIDVPPQILRDYEHLLSADHYPPCRNVIENMPKLTIHSWLSALGAERLAVKNEAIQRRIDESAGSWEEAFFHTLARGFGFGTNSEAFETWASVLPFMQAAHQRDDEFQTEALFLGVAGLLDEDEMTDSQRQLALNDDYFKRLKSEFAYLSHKYSILRMHRSAWQFMRLRPQNFPYIRLSQLSRLYCSRRADLSLIAACQTIDELHHALATDTSDYWLTHYTFGKTSAERHKSLSEASKNVLIINAIVPMLHAYGNHRHDEKLATRAIQLLDSVKAEDNNIVRLWAECGVKAENAADSQALLQLQQRYCDRKDCLRCRFGYYYMKKSNAKY